ncbi:prepilin-type N-terminal cleavage/methylation domain-containing protein [Luminiphilus sp.]|nr:prepilin-type N-terminal cleavage/methylation domain-containing protein [Luminiphilus sp.]MDA9711206.1 prepilin-type N-terminal cleavage/methylation domain-containing protein [Luminiphilus sp.]
MQLHELRHGRQSGMTLVEVTVASLIFAMIMLAVVTAMRTFGQSYERLQQLTDQTAQKREVDRFLRQVLRDALPEAGYFDGAAAWLEWVAPVDRVGSAGGLQHLKLEAKGKDLILHFAPFDRFGDPQDEPEWGAQVDGVALLEGLEKFRVYYRMLPEEGWADSPESSLDEAAEASLPWAVQLEIEAGGNVWPPVIVAFEQYGERR